MLLQKNISILLKWINKYKFITALEDNRLNKKRRKSECDTL